MFIKVKEKFEKTRHVKNNDKSRKYIYIFIRTKKCNISWTNSI